jgi:hypothetical protein
VPVNEAEAAAKAEHRVCNARGLVDQHGSTSRSSCHRSYRRSCLRPWKRPCILRRRASRHVPGQTGTGTFCLKRGSPSRGGCIAGALLRLLQRLTQRDNHELRSERAPFGADSGPLTFCKSCKGSCLATRFLQAQATLRALCKTRSVHAFAESTCSRRHANGEERCTACKLLALNQPYR